MMTRTTIIGDMLNTARLGKTYLRQCMVRWIAESKSEDRALTFLEQDGRVRKNVQTGWKVTGEKSSFLICEMFSSKWVNVFDLSRTTRSCMCNIHRSRKNVQTGNWITGEHGLCPTTRWDPPQLWVKVNLDYLSFSPQLWVKVNLSKDYVQPPPQLWVKVNPSLKLS